jgi:2-aminoadipate transaminase
MSFDASALWSDRIKSAELPSSYLTSGAQIVHNFDQGSPDPTLFPAADLLRIAQLVADRDSDEAFTYYATSLGYRSMFLGWTPLREEIARYVGRREPTTPDPDELIVVNGSSQGIALAANAFLQPGDAVVTEALTYVFAPTYFSRTGATVFAADLDGDGMDPESVDAIFRQAKADGLNPKMIYTIPTGQLPTGTIMPLDRRRRLTEIAQKWNVIVVEDVIYSPFQYEGEVIPSLYSLDPDGRVLQTDGFAKTVAPAIRIGWMLGSDSAIRGLELARQDLGSSMWLMRIMAQYLREGLLEPHIARSVPAYRRKRDLVDDALHEHCEGYVRWSPPKAAFYFWLELSDALDWQAVRAEMSKAGIAMRPGQYLNRAGGPSHLRLAFGHVNAAQLAKGIARLGEVMREVSAS